MTFSKSFIALSAATRIYRPVAGPRSRDPIMEPNAEYERVGFVGKVIFTNGHIVNGDEPTVHYGAADRAVCGAKFSLRAILQTLK